MTGKRRVYFSTILAQIYLWANQRTTIVTNHTITNSIYIRRFDCQSCIHAHRQYLCPRCPHKCRIYILSKLSLHGLYLKWKAKLEELPKSSLQWGHFIYCLGSSSITSLPLSSSQASGCVPYWASWIRDFVSFIISCISFAIFAFFLASSQYNSRWRFLDSPVLHSLSQSPHGILYSTPPQFVHKCISLAMSVGNVRWHMKQGKRRGSRCFALEQ